MARHLICEVCGNKYTTTSNNSKYCSRECWRKGQRRNKCIDCGEPIRKENIRCAKCNPKYYTGDKSATWKGKNTTNNKVCPICGKWMKWSSDICRQCYLSMSKGVDKEKRKAYIRAYYKKKNKDPRFKVKKQVSGMIHIPQR